MIISASRRTDIPAFYSQWFMNRIRAGFCTVPNPYNSTQVSYVPLGPNDVDVIVFWTRNPSPLISHLDKLDQRGYRYYFQFTILGYPQILDPKSPPVEHSIKVFQQLSERIGRERVIWRYDPVIFTSKTGANYHRQNFKKIANELSNYTDRVVVSIADIYPKLTKRLKILEQKGVRVIDVDNAEVERFSRLMHSLVNIATDSGLEMYSCAERFDLRSHGIQPGKCIDDKLIHSVFGISVEGQKDPSQREECGCVISKDIGMYDSCLFGCQYCYATNNFAKAHTNWKEHDPESPSLLGKHEVDVEAKTYQLNLL